MICAVNLMSASHRMPPKEKLVAAFQKLYYRDPTTNELASMKLDMQNENVILLVEVKNAHL
jgi:hypothetical protein